MRAQAALEPIHFVDRRLEQAHALRAFAQRDGQAPGPLCLALTGPWGVGRTGLAVRLARLLSERAGHELRPLTVDLDQLRDQGGVVVADALGRLLRSLGVRGGEWLEPSLLGRTEQYRQLSAERPFVLVLDNARTAAEIIPLLPASGASVVIVTSHTPLYAFQHLADLPLPLLPLPEADAAELLRLLLKDLPSAPDPQALRDLLTLCAGLPALLYAVAVRVRRRRGRTAGMLPGLEAALRDGELHMLTHLRDDEYRGLGADAARLYRLLAAAPGPSISEPACAALLGAGAEETGAALDELVESGLLTPLGTFPEPGPDGDPAPGTAHLGPPVTAPRFLLDSVTCGHADRCAAASGSAPETETARARLLGWLLRQGQRADTLLAGRRLVVAAEVPPPPGVPDVPLADAPAASSWLEAEGTVLYRAVALAHAHGLDAECLGLVEPLWTDQLDHPRHAEVLAAFGTAAASAQRAGDLAALVRARSTAARIRWEQRDFTGADKELTAAEGTAQALGDSARDRKLRASLREFRGMWHGAIAKAADDETVRKEEWGRAIRCFTDSRALHEAIPNAYGVLLQTYREGEALLHLGRAEEAAVLLERAREGFRADGRLRLTGRSTYALACALRLLDRRPEALRLGEEALGNARERRAGREEERILLTLAVLAEETGDPDRARAHRTSARTLRERNGGLREGRQNGGLQEGDGAPAGTA